MGLHTMDPEFRLLAKAVAGELTANEADAPSNFSEFEELDIDGVDKIALSLPAFVIGSATSIDVFPQIGDRQGGWIYMTEDDGSIKEFTITGATRTNRQIPPFDVRGMRFRILVKGTGTLTTTACTFEIQRFRNSP